MIAESVSEGLLDPEEHTRLTRALQIGSRVVGDVAVSLDDVRAVPVAASGSGPTIGAVESALAETGYSRFPVAAADGKFIGYLHIKDMLTLGDDPQTVIDLALVRPLPQVPISLPLADALSRMRRSNSHLALVTDDDAASSRWWRWRTWWRIWSAACAMRSEPAPGRPPSGPRSPYD